MLDRLYLDAGRIEAMATGIREVVALPDPIGEVLETNHLENGLVITKKRVAMGVIGIIYESRPNVSLMRLLWLSRVEMRLFFVVVRTPIKQPMLLSQP